MIDEPIDKLRDIVRDKPTTLDIITSMLDDENIEMKTEITNPYALDTLMVFAKHMKKCGFKDAGNILKFWKNLLLKYMVSNKRMSRKEITEILKGYFTIEREKEKNLSLTSNLAKMNESSF